MSKHVIRHDPLVRIVKRTDIENWQNWCIRAAAVLIALVLGGLFIFSVTKLNPLQVYAAMFDGALGTTRRTWFTVRDTMMLLCIGVGLAPAFKMRFWNVGAEGQILVGGCATAGVMLYFGDAGLPTVVLMLIMALASIAAGIIWGVVPAVFKARWGTNETLFTLMMNYVAIQITSYCVALWENPFGSNTVGVINQATKVGWFPKVFGTDYGLNVIIVMVLAIGMYIYLKYSKQGYEISVLGESENTARYAGIKPSKVFIRTMAISGAICGLAGFIAVAGSSHTISTSTAGGRGFTAIIVAWLAKFNSFYMLLISFLLVFMEKGAVEIASQFKLNDFASDVIMGIVLFCIIASEFFINYRLIFRGQKNSESGNRAVKSGGYCNVLLHVLGLLFTFGVWQFIWTYKMTCYTNAAENEKERSPMAQMLLTMFIPYYNIFWTYQTARRVDKIAEKKGIASNISVLCLVLAILVPIVPPILLQVQANKNEKCAAVMDLEKNGNIDCGINED